MSCRGIVNPANLSSDQVYFHFPFQIILRIHRHFQASSDRGQADLERSRRTPSQGRVGTPVAYVSETADLLECFRDVDSACHESIAGRFCATLSCAHANRLGSVRRFWFSQHAQ
jgi:hypothetical protein